MFTRVENSTFGLLLTVFEGLERLLEFILVPICIDQADHLSQDVEACASLNKQLLDGLEGKVGGVSRCLLI